MYTCCTGLGAGCKQMKPGGKWGRVSRGYAYTLGMLLLVGCGGSEEARQEPPDESPGFQNDAGTGSETGTPDSGTVTVEPPPDAGSQVDAGTEPDAGVPDAGAPDGGSGHPPGDGGTDAGTPGGSDGGTSTPDAGVPPVSGGPAPRSKYWRASYYAGMAPGGLAVGDFTGDFVPDVVVNDLGASLQSRYRARPGSFVLLVNDGKGALGKPSARRRLHSSSGRIAAGYGDLDSHMDVLLGTRYGALLLSGNGDGTFDDVPIGLAHGHVSNLGFWPGQSNYVPRVWAVGDGEESGNGPATEGGFQMLAPTEDGRLALHSVNVTDGRPVVAPLDSGIAVAVDDFDESGNMDIVLSSDRWPLTRFLGTSGYDFTAWALVERRPDLLTAADVNRDGHADLVAVDGKELWTYLGKGDGNFSTGLMTPIPTVASRLVVAEANSDGKPDVVLLHREAGQVSIWWGNGLGRFDTSSVLATGRLPSDAAVDYLDPGLVPELLVAEAGDNVVSVYSIPHAPVAEAPITPRCPMGLRDGLAGGSAPEPLLTLDTGTRHTGPGRPPVAVGDFDGNGHTDLALLSNERKVRLLLGDGEGGFQTRDVLRDAEVTTLEAGDFNGDGLSDLATISWWSGLQVRWSDGKDFPDATTIPVFADEGGYLVAADFNRDGRVDLGASLRTSCPSRGILLTNQGGGVLKQNELPDHNVEPDDQCGGSARPLVADFNGDGTLDLVHHTLGHNLNYTTKEGTVVPGEGFLPAYLGGGGAESAGDVDGDGAVDLLLSGPEGMTVVRGDGGGTFQGALLCRMKAAGQALFEAVDVNGDGIVDLLGTDPAGAVLVVSGEGGGTYRPAVRYPLEAKPVWAAPVDVLGDGRPELVVLLASGLLKVFPTP